MGTRFLIVALISGALVAGCGSDDDGAEQAESATAKDEIRLTPSQESKRASRAPFEVSVAPETGAKKSVIRVSFASRIRLGPTGDGRRRSYYAVARYQRPTAGCVEDREAYVDRGQAGQRVAAAIDPARGKGGELGWCRGPFRGVVRYYDGFACPRTGRCRIPDSFEKINRVVARFRFRIE